jgi:predicted nucleotidyltransferase
MQLTVQDLKDKGLLLFEAISGSRAYGTNKETSDTDYRGVYILPLDNLLGFEYIEQVSDATNDAVYYELGRFLQLLQTQNPNIIELLNMPEENITFKHPEFDRILKHKDQFISKVCRDSFGGYAVAQIKKARGLKKKIVNPVDKERKSILDFCFVVDGYNSRPLKEFLDNSGYEQSKCGLVNVPHARDIYALFYDHYQTIGYRGITNDDDTSNEVRLSSIPKGETPIATVIYNKDGYTMYCRDYKEYWEWVEKRNDDRYQTNQEHGKGYDSKNMMHCIRLIRMAIEIAEQKQVIVKRPDSAELLTIRNGDAEYDDLLAEAEEKIKMLEDKINEQNLEIIKQQKEIDNLKKRK